MIASSSHDLNDTGAVRAYPDCLSGSSVVKPGVIDRDRKARGLAGGGEAACCPTVNAPRCSLRWMAWPTRWTLQWPRPAIASGISLACSRQVVNCLLKREQTLINDVHLVVERGAKLIDLARDLDVLRAMSWRLFGLFTG
jgi:hypothetical protein